MLLQFNMIGEKELLHFSQNISTEIASKYPLKKSIYDLKGHLRYKITPQNVSSEAQIKNFFLSWKNYNRKVMIRSRDIQVFAFLTIP